MSAGSDVDDAVGFDTDREAAGSSDAGAAAGGGGRASGTKEEEEDDGLSLALTALPRFGDGEVTARDDRSVGMSTGRSGAVSYDGPQRVRCCILGRRVLTSEFSDFELNRADLNRRRSREGCERVWRELAAKHKVWFQARKVHHESVFEAIRGHNFYRVYRDVLKEIVTPNMKDPETGRTLLHEAAAVGDEEMCIFLLDHGASLDSRGLMGRDSVLHFAVMSDNVELVEGFLRMGLDPGVLNRHVFTPLHYAQSIAMAKLLLRSGAAVDAKDRFGRTPSQAADARGFTDVRDYLSKKHLEKLKLAEKERHHAGLRTRENAEIAAKRAEEDRRVRVQDQRRWFLRRMAEEYKTWARPEGHGEDAEGDGEGGGGSGADGRKRAKPARRILPRLADGSLAAISVRLRATGGSASFARSTLGGGTMRGTGSGGFDGLRRMITNG